MTRKEIEAEFTIKDGVIQDLGKFEGEMLYAPYFSENAGGGEELSVMENGAGEYVSLIEVSAEDRAEFPEIGKDTHSILLTESDSGFIGVQELTESQAEDARAEYAPSEK